MTVVTAGDEVVSRVTDCLPTGGSECYKLISDPHLSLFRGESVIRHHHIDLLVQSLQQKLSKLYSFSIALRQIRTLHNEAGSRSFVCVCSEEGGTNVRLQRVLDAVKGSLSDFIDVKEYADAFIPHVSLLWFQDREQEVGTVTLQALQQEFGPDPLLVRVTHVDLRIGNRDYSIRLRNT